MNYQEREELDAEFNARYDYISELRAEHDDSSACLYDAFCEEVEEGCFVGTFDEYKAERIRRYGRLL